MSLIGNDYPHYDWEWRNVFIKLSDKIGEFQNPTVAEIRDIRKCEEHLLMMNKYKFYPLKHKVGKKEYLFYMIAGSLYFKAYEGEPYFDKYGKWWNDQNQQS